MVELTTAGCWAILTTGGTALTGTVGVLWVAFRKCHREHLEDLRQSIQDVRKLRGR